LTIVRRWLTNQRGFTLAELVVVTAVTGLVMTGLFVIQKQGQEAYLFGSNRVETQQNARVALDLLSRELRSATPTGAAPTGVVSIPTSTDMTFLDQTGQTIRYCWSSSATGCVSTGARTYLVRTVNGANATAVIGGVTSFGLTYCCDYNANANPACTPPCSAYNPSATPPCVAPTQATNASTVRVVKIALGTKSEEGATASSVADDARATMESTVKLRGTIQ